jgi:chaperonin cofactor prefoldin
MLTRTRIAAVIAALAAFAALPTVANAATVPMRGVVSGSPYGASAGQMAIPVLFSKTTAGNAGLKSPVGVIIVGRNQKVQLPGGGSTIPINLRTGDRFKGTGVVGSLQRKVFYPRIVFPTTIVYFRSKELSVSELSLAVELLRKSLADLQAQLDSLKSASIKAFQDVYAQLADLRKQLEALLALKVPDFQAQIDALNKKLNDLIASLPDFSKFALITQLTQYVQLSNLTSLLTGNPVITTLQGQVTTLQGQVSTLTSRLNAVCTSLKSGTVTLDPDGAGPLPPVTAPVTLPGISAPGACP